MKPALQLVLVRHGETEWTERGLLHGRLDSPLSARGRRHAQQTARALHGESFRALYSSPQGRALETAAIIGEAIGLRPQALDGLREVNFGWLEGKPLALVDPDLTGAKPLRSIVRLALTLTAERPPSIARRVEEAVKEIVGAHPPGRMLIVTHWGVISMIMAQLIDSDPSRWRNHGPWAACSISELQAVNGGWQIVRLNDHAHHQEEELHVG